jgi:hypothetical protein
MKVGIARFPWTACLLLGLSGLCLGLTGCGKYTVRFQVEDVINDGGKGDAAAEQLDVDIVTVTKADAKDFPELLDGAWRSKDWFAARDKGDPKIRKLESRKHIIALCKGKPDPEITRLGDPLLSGRRTNQKEVMLKVPHPESLAGESAFVVFGRFHDGQGGILDARPVVIHPLPAWNMDIVINVGRTSMVRLDSK